MTETTDDLIAFVRTMKLLVAEDSLINRKVLELVLKQHHIEADFAENGRQVLERLSGNKVYDVILMDLDMPEMNGYEACTYIRTVLRLSIPIIALSGYVLEEEKNKCLAAGMNDYLQKPVHFPALLQKTAELIREAKATAATEPGISVTLANKIIDLEYIRTVFRGNIAAQIKVLGILAEELPFQLDRILHAVADRDFTQALHTLHQIKTSVMMLGMTEAATLLSLLEAELKEHKPSTLLPERLHAAEQLLRSAFEEIELLLPELRMAQPS